MYLKTRCLWCNTEKLVGAWRQGYSHMCAVELVSLSTAGHLLQKEASHICDDEHLESYLCVVGWKASPLLVLSCEICTYLFLGTCKKQQNGVLHDTSWPRHAHKPSLGYIQVMINCV